MKLFVELSYFVAFFFGYLSLGINQAVVINRQSQQVSMFNIRSIASNYVSLTNQIRRSGISTGGDHLLLKAKLEANFSDGQSHF
mmetsp:Transcript_36252/g.87488  ORF Transcript_36252/g.87488 Transcript_36252/m.87488 type:complete len:84 (+) Transcript_36252:1819-2070(+)